MLHLRKSTMQNTSRGDQQKNVYALNNRMTRKVMLDFFFFKKIIKVYFKGLIFE